MLVYFFNNNIYKQKEKMMRLITTTLLFTLLSLAVYSQNSNLIFFTEGGEKFTLYVNGVKSNTEPLANVKVEDINMEMAQIRVVFETPGAPELKSAMYIERGMEMTSMIMKNNKGKYVFRPSGSVPVSQSKPSGETIAIKQAAPVGDINTNSGTTTTTTTSTSTGTVIAPAGNVVDVNVTDGASGVSMNINMNVDGIQQTTGTTMTTTSVTTSGSYSESSTAQKTQANDAPVVREGCTTPMSSSDFGKAKQSIVNKSYSEEKMTIFNQILRANCVSVSQVIGFMELFTYEADKLTAAKNAYKKTVDKGNYYQVNDAFTYSASVTELNAFLENQ